MTFNLKQLWEGKHPEVVEAPVADVASVTSSDDDKKSIANGIAEIEAVTQTWTKTQLYISWAAIILISTAMAFETQAIGVFGNYATSEFAQYSLLSTIQVVTGVIGVVMKPILAKVSDCVGRLEGFIICILGLTLGPVLLAASKNIGTWFAGQVFLTIGQVGINFMATCFALDSTDFTNRMFMMTITGFSFIFTPWAVAPMTTRFLEGAGWRWGIGIWAIITPVCGIPLLIVLIVNRVKAIRLGLKRTKLSFRKLAIQMDLIGLVLLSAGLALVFVAIPLASANVANTNEWRKPYIIVMIIIGGILLISFPFYEIYVPQYPLMTLHVFKNFAITRSFFFIMCYYLAFYTYSSYYFGWLMVVMNLGNTAATNVNAVAGVATTCSAIGAGIVMKFYRRLKWAIVGGACLVMIGFGLVYKFRNIGTTVGQLVGSHLIYGVGSGVMTTPNGIFVQSYCSHTEIATTVSLYNSFLSLGQVVGDSVSGAIYRQHYPKLLRQAFPDKNETWVNGIFNDYTQALTYQWGSDERTKINEAYNSVMRLLLIPPLVFYACMFIIGVSLPDVKLDKVKHGLKGLILGDAKAAPAQSPREHDEEHLQQDSFMRRRNVNDNSSETDNENEETGKTTHAAY